MSESGFYPPGAEGDPRAPYNEAEQVECPSCEGTGKDTPGPGASLCHRCEGSGLVQAQPEDF